MTLLAYDPARLVALERALEDLQTSLEVIQRSAPQDTLRQSLAREIAFCEGQRQRVVMVLQSAPLWTASPWVRHPSWPIADVERWVDTHPSWWAKATVNQTTGIDVLLSRIADDHEAASALVDGLESVAPIVYGAHDIDVVQKFWMTVTDPRTTPPAVAAHRIRQLLTTVFGDHTWSHGPARSSIDPVERRRLEAAVRDMLGAIIAPWQFHFSGMASAWSWSADEGLSWLHLVARSATAAADLARGLGPAVARMLGQLPDRLDERRRIIDEVGFGVGASLEVLYRAGVDDAGRDHSTWTTFEAVVDLIPLDAPWPVSVLVDRGASWLDEQLVIDLPAPHVAERQSTLAGHQVLAGLAVLTVWRTQWKEPKRSATPADHAEELRHTYDAIDAPATRGRLTADTRVSR